MKPRVLSPKLVYFPTNGVVSFEGKTLVRLVYAQRETTETILEAIVQKYDPPAKLEHEYLW